MGQVKSKAAVRRRSRAQSPNLHSTSPSRSSLWSLPAVGTDIEESNKLKATTLKKTSSTLNVSSTSQMKGNRKVKRRHSFRKQVEDPYMKLREKIAKEAKGLDDWVSERPGVAQTVPSLTDLSTWAISSRMKQPSDVQRLPLTQELKDAVEFRTSPRFDQTTANENVVISNDGRTVKYKGRGYSTTVMQTPFRRGFKQGRHAWLTYIDCSRVIGWMQIGIVNEERMATGCKTVWDGNPHPFREGELARRNNGNIHRGQTSLTHTVSNDLMSLGGYTTGDTIGIKLDLEEHTIQWTRNGENYGPPENIHGEEFFPSFSLDSPGEALTLAYYCGPAIL